MIASQKVQDSVSSKQLGYWAEYFAVLLTSWQPINRPHFIKIKSSVSTMHLLILHVMTPKLSDTNVTSTS
jgi:hypothetical protein